MTFTSPFTAVTGAIITAAGWNTSGRDNINHLRAIVPDPGVANYWLQSTSATIASWVNSATAVLAAINASSGDATVTGILTGTNLVASNGVTAGGNIASSGGSVSAAGSVTAGGNITSTGGSATVAGNYTSQATTGTPPLVVASTTKVTNLNADLLDDQTGSYYLDKANHTGSTSVASVPWKQGKTNAFTGSQSLTTSYADAAGASISADRDGQWLVIATSEYTAAVGDGVPSTKIVAGGVDQDSGIGVLVAGSTTVSTSSAIALVTVSGTTTIKAQVKKATGSAGSVATYVKVTAIWLAP